MYLLPLLILIARAQEPATVPAEEGALCVYDAGGPPALRLTVQVDGLTMVYLAPSEFACLRLPAGTHDFSLISWFGYEKMDPWMDRVTVLPGEVVELKCDFKIVGGFGGAELRLTRLTATQGSELRRTYARPDSGAWGQWTEGSRVSDPAKLAPTNP